MDLKQICLKHEFKEHRIHPNGTFKKTIDLPCGTFETVEAKSGYFSAVYGRFAFVLTKTPSQGPVKINKEFTKSTYDNSGQLSFFCPDDHVQGKFSDPLIYDILMVDNNYFSDLIAREFSLTPDQMRSRLRIKPSSLMNKIWNYFLSTKDEIDNTNLNLMSEILITSYLCLHSYYDLHEGSYDPYEKISKAIDHIKCHIDQKIYIEELAEMSHMSKFHFTRVFFQITGLTPHQFIMECRLQKGKRLIQSTGKSIIEISFECGFSSQSHFTTLFKKAFGCTPAQFRKKLGKS